MQQFMLAKKSKRLTRFGSLGASNASFSATPSNTPVLRHLSYSQSGSNRRTILYNKGAWTGNRARFKPETRVTIHYETDGNEQSNGFLFASFGERRGLTDVEGKPIDAVGGVRQFLFIKPISPANGHNLLGSVSIYIPKQVPDLIFYLHDSLPIDIQGDYLDKSDLKPILTPGILSSEPLPLSTFRSPTLGFTPKNPPSDGFDTKGSRSEHYDLWDGKVTGKNSISWKKHGYSGSQEALTSGVTLDSPRWTASGDPYYALRSSIYQYREGTFKEFGGKELKGWDAVRINGEVPAGQPMRLVLEGIRHDRDKQSWKSMPEWHDMGGSIKKEKVWFGPIPTFAYNTGKKHDEYQVNVGPLSDTVIDYRINPGWSLGLGKTMNKGNFVKNTKGDGEPWTDIRDGYTCEDLRHFGFKVEWWTGSDWTTPQIHPPDDIKLKNGWGSVIFRFPRQLSPNAPDIADTPDWSVEKTWDCYPQVIGWRDDKNVVKYKMIGRMRVVNEETGKEEMPELTMPGGQIVYGDNSCNFFVCVGVGDQILTSGSDAFAVADPSTYAYVNSPQFNNVYWKEGEFAPGCTMIVIGQGLNRVWEMGLSKKHLDEPNDIRKRLKDVDRTIPNAGGTQNADFLKIEKVITSNLLLDTVASSQEEEVKKAWRDIFGVELSASWFDIVGTGGTLPDGTTLSPLKAQSPTKSTHYIVEHSGEQYEFPYTIAVVKVPKSWVGPVLDFDISSGSPILTSKSLKKGERTYLITKTAFQQIVEQELNLDEEIQMQLDLLEKGLSPAEVLVGNDTDHDAITTTAEVVDQNRVDNLVGDEEGSSNKGMFGWLFNLFSWERKETISDSAIRRRTLFPVGTTQKVPIAGLGSPVIVEDVTATYSADHAGLGSGPINRRGPTHRKINYDNFEEIEEVYVMNGKPSGPSLDWFAGATPVSPSDVRPDVVERKQFGSVGQQSMHSRAVRRGNPMDVTLVSGASRPFREGSRRRHMR